MTWSTTTRFQPFKSRTQSVQDLRGAPASWSIRTRLLLVVLATTLTGLFTAAAAMMFYDVRHYRQTLAADLAAQVEIVGHASLPALRSKDRDAARESLSKLTTKPHIAAGALYHPREGLLAAYSRDGEANADVPATPSADGARLTGNQMVLVRRLVQNGELLGVVYVRGDYNVWPRLRHYATIMGGVLGISLVAALLMSIWLQSTITAPILAIRDVAQWVVEKRDFTLRAHKTTNDEIGYLADAFNGMLAEIGNRTNELERSSVSLAGEIKERETAQRALLRAEDDLRGLNADLEQRVVQRTEELAAANKELESFSYSVSHDLRAPVRAIAGFSKLLAEQHEEQLDPEARRKLGIVRSEAARMGALIDDLLAFSRLGRQSLQMKSVDMAELVRMNLDTLNAGHGAANPRVTIGTLPAAHGDRSVLAQVWANLLANAYKFSARKDDPEIEVDAYESETENVYFVRDNGVGFDARYVSKLFGVFQRLHDPAEFPGTGVGLALVQRIVARHGGRVWAEGEVDAGATFYFSLPRREEDGSV
jgi:signal transduction histidine kinase